MKERETEMKRFVLSVDGFTEIENPMTLEQVKDRYFRMISNPYLYQYDVSVYELGEDGKIGSMVSRQELGGK